ncbi:alpha/beta fold hydrolase [Mesobacterium pallidum]|uniref:alpha/beta fold hydrolase n=1 Tax=Mesobacterium pallidum TaxID=2872037 RepID=UPI001EE297BB|nr:alpha/beta hydrolase [Mesobacterium pallidum]
MPHFTTSDGLSLYYEDEGDGLPLLCLTGLTRNTGDFQFVAPHLYGVRQIRMDYRGRGRSDWAEPSTYTPIHEGRDALELLDHLGIDKAAILGSSRGGLIAMVLGRTARDRLLGAALNDVGPVLETGGLGHILTYLGKRPPFRSLAEAAAARPAAMAGFDNVPEARWLAEVTASYDETPQGLDIRYDPRLRDSVEAVMQADPVDMWPFFDALCGLPLALIHGANSNLLSDAGAQAMRDRCPSMHYAKVPDRGHIPFLDEPAALAVLNDWLESMR